MAQKRVGIIGSGIAGPVFGLHLLTHPTLRQRFKPILFDKAKDPGSASPSERDQTAGAGIALFANGLFPLHSLGLEEALREFGRDTPAISLWKSFPADRPEWDHKHLGTMRNGERTSDIKSQILAIERKDLQALIVQRFEELGGEMHWNKTLAGLQRVEDGRMKAVFTDGEETFDLLVGADGAYSRVRRFILEEKDSKTAEARWVPDYMGATGLYGIASNVDKLWKQRPTDALSDTHGIWLPVGNLSSSPLPRNKLRWDLILPEKHVSDAKKGGRVVAEASWTSAIQPGGYDQATTVELLQNHLQVYHPVSGTFEKMLDATDRIIHTPLRQRVWEVDEIQRPNVVLLGDAASLFLPSSGQGTGFAIEDATVLANSLLNSRVDDGFKEALNAYARLRVPRSKQVATAAAYAMRMGLAEKWWWRWIRNASSYFASWGGNLGDSWPINGRFQVKEKG